MSNPKIFPVVHYLDRPTAFAEVAQAIECGADGCFLISHLGDDAELLDVATDIQKMYPAFPVGVNLLSRSAEVAARQVNLRALPMMWADYPGVDSTGIQDLGREVTRASYDLFDVPGFDVFASVAFKYQPVDPDPALAAKNALAAGFIPTTSGEGTGKAPSLDKVIAMSAATGGVLAIASGMTPWNVGAFAPYLSHILVATGVAWTEHHIDAEKLRLLISNSRAR